MADGASAIDQAPMLFLHGAFGGPEMWRRFVAPWFAARGRRVAAPELRPAERRDARLRDYVAAACAAADALGAPPVLVGHSLGGLVAQHVAARRRVAGMVLVGSPGPFGAGGALWRLTLARPKALAALMVAQMGGGALLGVEAARRTLFTDATPDRWIVENAPRPERESPMALMDALALDLPNWLLARGAPTLALHPAQDAFVPVSDLVALAFAYGAETEVLGDMAHGAPIDPHWKRLAWRIEDWIQTKSTVRRV
jgi:pimeloyl-ACP methyl ester carboxylesterase